METTILIVDDHDIFRMGLNLLLAEEDGLRVVGEAGDGREAINQVRELAPDVVIMDISMPDMDGIEATAHIFSEAPETKIIALSIHAEKEFVEDMLRAGAAGYVIKERALEDLAGAIHAVQRGELFLSETIKDVVLSRYMEQISEGIMPADEPAYSPLLTTKLHRPRVPHAMVVRPRLLEQLQVARELPLTLVSAAAGYGKSILVSQWLESCDWPSAWLSLDTGDNDLRLFLTYLVAAVRTQFPEALRETAAVLEAITLPPAQPLAQTLINDLERLPEPFILVLDDYHLITEAAVHTLLGALLRHPPRSLHLVLVSRTDPALDLLQMRARRQLGEVRAQALSFTVSETDAFLENVVGSAVDRSIAEEITRRTEGWVTGLHLLTISVSDSAGLAGLSGTPLVERHTLDYLASEALSRQPRAIQTWLLKNSILDRFCASLCEAVCTTLGDEEASRNSGEEFIQYLTESNLFVISQDQQNRWFRYHHLFQQLLQIQLASVLDSKEIAELHRRAAAWFAENGQIDEALQHALAADDVDYAAQVVEQHRYDLMNREQWSRLERWLKMLPPEEVAKRPSLIMAHAYLIEHLGQVAESFVYRDQAEALLPTLPEESPERKALQGEIAVLYSEQYIIAGDVPLILENSELALELLPANALHIWSYAIGAQALAYQIAGDLSQGFEIINGILRTRAALPAIVEARMMLWFCLAYWMEGDPNGLKTPADRCLTLGEQYELLESQAFGRFFLGVGYYARNEMVEAERYLAALASSPYTARPQYLAHGALALAKIYLAQGSEKKAADVIEFVIAHSVQTNDAVGLATIRAAQVELALLQGKVREAQRLNEHAVYDLIPLIWFPYIPQLTPVKLLLAQNTEQSLEQALDELNKLDDFVRKMNRKTIRMDVLALKSLILDAQGKEPEAYQALTESLTLGERGGFIRSYVDLGPKMAGLLARVQRQGVTRNYVTRILAAFPDARREAPDARDGARSQPGHLSYGSRQTTVDLLTRREREVMRLLATRMTITEISFELTLSKATVRTHIKHIYSKLDAHSRTEAVIIARRLGLLKDS